MQVAAQQGQYLAKLLAKNGMPEDGQLPHGTKPFKYGHKGSLAYVGQVRSREVQDLRMPAYGQGVKVRALFVDRASM